MCRPVFKELKLSGEKHIILDYEIEHIVRILGQADEVDFMKDYQSYVITNLVSIRTVEFERGFYSLYNFVILSQDAHTLTFNEFAKSMANITLIRLVDPENEHVKNAVEEILFNEQKHKRARNLSPNTIKVSMEMCE